MKKVIFSVATALAVTAGLLTSTNVLVQQNQEVSGDDSKITCYSTF